MCKKYLRVLPTAYKTLYSKVSERERERKWWAFFFLSIHCVSLQDVKKLAKSPIGTWHKKPYRKTVLKRHVLQLLQFLKHKSSETSPEMLPTDNKSHTNKDHSYYWTLPLAFWYNVWLLCSYKVNLFTQTYYILTGKYSLRIINKAFFNWCYSN